MSCLVSWLSLEWMLASCLLLGLFVIGMGADLVLCSCSKCQVEVADVSVSNGLGGVTIKNSLSFD